MLHRPFITIHTVVLLGSEIVSEESEVVSELVAVLGLQVASHIGHELVEALHEPGLLIRRLQFTAIMIADNTKRQKMIAARIMRSGHRAR